jgi:hypothetical protein
MARRFRGYSSGKTLQVVRRSRLRTAVSTLRGSLFRMPGTTK